MERDENRRLSEIDDETFGGMRTDYDDETYEVMREWFTREPLEELLSYVERTHESIWLPFLIELQWAAGLLHKSIDHNARLAGYLRAYRAVESYQHGLTEAIVTSYARPFLPVHEGHAIRARAFFHPRALDVIRDQVLDAVFHTPDVRTSLAAFFRDNKDVRNHVVHGLKDPTHDEFRALLVAAVAIYDLADQSLHGPRAGGAKHIFIPLLDEYDHDDYRVPPVVIPDRPASARCRHSQALPE